MTEPFPLEPSLWAATAPPAPSTPPLAESVAADVCIVGAGYCGLSTALHLAERGIKAVVLEAKAANHWFTEAQRDHNALVRAGLK